MTLTSQPTIPPIHPDLLERLLQSLHEADFNSDSTLYHVGYQQAQRDFKRLLERHLNKPLPEAGPPPVPAKQTRKSWWQR